MADIFIAGAAASAAVDTAVELVKKLKSDAPRSFVPPSEGTKASNEFILPAAMVRNTRGYIEKTTNQINGCYEKGWFDGCAVMMRKLMETLIIECFEKYGIDSKIKNDKGDFFYLRDLIDKSPPGTSGGTSRMRCPD